MEMFEGFRILVSVPVSHGTDDLTDDPVYMALVSEDGRPEDSDWQAAAWSDDGAEVQLLVGEGGDVELETGRYGVWVKVTDSPEVPGGRAGFLTVR